MTISSQTSDGLTDRANVLLDRVLKRFEVRQKGENVGGDDLDEILRHHRGVGEDALVALQRVDDAHRFVAEAQLIDAMREVERNLVEQWADMDVAAGEVDAPAACNVKIARHLVQRERSVDAARVERPVRLHRPLRQVVGGVLVPSVHNVLEDEILQTEEHRSSRSISLLEIIYR